MDIQVNGLKGTDIRTVAHTQHLHGYPYGYPYGCPYRIIRATDSSTRGGSKLMNRYKCVSNQGSTVWTHRYRYQSHFWLPGTRQSWLFRLKFMLEERQTASRENRWSNFPYFLDFALKRRALWSISGRSLTPLSDESGHPWILEALSWGLSMSAKAKVASCDTLTVIQAETGALAVRIKHTTRIVLLCCAVPP